MSVTDQKPLMNTDDKILRILQEELVPAMGCTEPIAIAFAAAKAREVLNEPVESAVISCSSNIIKNVKCVRVPNTGGLIGVEAAALAGIVAGDSTKKLEVINEVSDAQRQQLRTLLESRICTVRCLDTDLTLHILAEVKGRSATAAVEITCTHTHIQSIRRNGVVIDHDDMLTQSCCDRSCLSVSEILDFARRIDLKRVEALIDRQIRLNMAISEEGQKGGYGVHISEIVLSESSSLPSRMAASAAAASEARMEGCALPVVTNSGSGNQGITASVPVIVYAREKNLSHPQLLRGLLVSNLLCVHLKTGIGHLSAFCGVVAASSAVSGALTYLEGGTAQQVGSALKNTLASLAGMCCDGAKATCGFKIVSSIQTAYYASRMALKNRSYNGNVGILKDDVEDSIAAIGKLASRGMRETDRVILQIMLDQI